MAIYAAMHIESPWTELLIFVHMPQHIRASNMVYTVLDYIAQSVCIHIILNYILKQEFINLLTKQAPLLHPPSSCSPGLFQMADEY